MNVKKLYERIEEIDKELEFEYEDGETCWAANLEAERERIEEAICILEENEIESVEQIIVTGIKWDAPKSAGLPKRVVIEITLDNVELLEDFNGYADNLSDYLSDTYGYCHEGFKVKCKAEDKFEYEEDVTDIDEESIIVDDEKCNYVWEKE